MWRRRRHDGRQLIRSGRRGESAGSALGSTATNAWDTIRARALPLDSHERDFVPTEGKKSPQEQKNRPTREGRPASSSWEDDR
jgi:hypothetical protein